MAEVKVYDIQWLQDSPYGTYVQNDLVSIYIDTTTAVLVVKKNGATITAGNDIPLYFSYAGQNQDYYKLESSPGWTLICDPINIGSSLLWSRFQSAFPYLYLLSFPNSLGCETGGIVCDLAFDSIPEILHATGPSVGDGSFTVSASSTYGPVEYKVNADFVYGDSTGQTSGTFINKQPGTYIVFARDSKNCSTQIQVIVEYDESLGVLYRGDYFDKLGNVSRIEILKRAYSDSVTEVIFGKTPLQFSLRGEGGENIFKPILSTEVIVTLKATVAGAFSDLYTNNPEMFRVRWSKNVDGAGFTTLWEGKLLPNQFTESLVTVPYEVSVTAVDDLAQLKSVQFLTGQTNLPYGLRSFRFTGLIKQVKILAFALQKLRFNYNIRIACNLYATGMATTASDDPFDQAYINTDVYYLKEDEIPSVDFVINSMLEPYGCRLILWENRWNIIRVEEMTGSYDYREFDSNGDYVGNGTTNPILFVRGATKENRLVWRDRSQNVNMLPGYGSISVMYNLGLQNNILRNGDFRLKGVFNPAHNTEIPEPDLYGWKIASNGESPTLSYEVLDVNNIAIKISNGTGLAYIISAPIEIQTTQFERLLFKIRYRLPNQHLSLKYQKIKVRVSYGTWHLKADGTWTNSVNEFAFYQSTYGQYVESEILAEPIGAYTSTQGLAFQVRIYHSYALDLEFTSLASLKAKATTSLSLGTRTEYRVSFTMRYYELEENTSTPNDVDIVRPNDYHATTNPVQWILKAQQASDQAFNKEFFIDKISVGSLSNGNAPMSVFPVGYVGQQNNRNKLEVPVFFGSFVEQLSSFSFFPNAKLLFVGYLSDSSGTGFNTWKRDAVSESKKLHDILLSQLSAQYGTSRRRITGTLYSDDIYLTPINCLQETLDGNRKYILMALTIDDKENNYQVEMIEHGTVTDDSSFGYGFTSGFSLGFNA